MQDIPEDIPPGQMVELRTVGEIRVGGKKVTPKREDEHNLYTGTVSPSDDNGAVEVVLDQAPHGGTTRIKIGTIDNKVKIVEGVVADQPHAQVVELDFK